MPDTRLPKVIFYSELANGKRKTGAPKKRYKDSLKCSLKDCFIDVKTWENLSLDRRDGNGEPLSQRGARLGKLRESKMLRLREQQESYNKVIHP